MHIEFELVQNIYEYIAIFYFSYLAVYSTFLLISVSVGSASLYEQRKRQRLYNFLSHDYYLPVSIIVPAFNEGVTVVDTVSSLLALDYKLYEIIVVDDGSDDGTSQVLINHFHMEKIERPIRKKIPCKREVSVHVAQSGNIAITLIRKKNGGKADSLNMGINASRHPYYICMDADSVLQKDALTNIVRPMLENSNMIACGGLVRIVNDVTIQDGRVVSYRMPKSWLLCMQVLEYDRTFLASRLLFDKFNGNLIISGAFGLFKKDIVIAAGGYDHTTVGEDMELVIRLHAYCRANNIDYSIKYAADAVCWSQAPPNLAGLQSQRRRWHIGLFQSMWKHRTMIFNPAYGLVSFISFIYFLIYELLSPYIEVFGILSMIVAYFYKLINVPFMISLLLIYSFFSGMLSVTAFFSRIHAMEIKLHPTDLFKAIALCMVENLGLRVILMLIRLFAFVGYRKNKLEWGEIERLEMNK